jgi:hypothetical protein
MRWSWAPLVGTVGLGFVALACVGDDPVSPPTIIGSSGSSGDAATPTDAGTSVVPDAAPDAPPGFSPLDLGPNIVLWLDASNAASVVTAANLVGEWTDLSASTPKNSAKQSNSVYRPTVSKAAANGHDAVHFSIAAGTCRHLEIPDATSLQWDGVDFAIEMVARYVNDPTSNTPPIDSQAVFWTKQSTTIADKPGVRLIGNPPPFTQHTTAAYAETSKAYDDTTLGPLSSQNNLNDGKFHIFGLRYIGVHLLEVRVDGAAGTKSNVGAATVSLPGVPVAIGGEVGNVNCVDGDIAEVVAYKGTLGDTNVAELEDYFRKKYFPVK